jgi:hypothetical protein
MITQEAVTAEINYRLERAQAAAFAQQVRKTHPTRLRRWLARVSRPAPASLASDPASRAYGPRELRFHVRHEAS